MRYILSWDYYNKVKNCLDDIDENEEEIRQLADDEDFDEDRKYFGLLIEDSRKELLEIFEEYCESNRKHENFKKAIEEVREYGKNLEKVALHQLNHLLLIFHRIGTEINQIAKVANSTQSVFRKDVEELKEKFSYLSEVFDEYLILSSDIKCTKNQANS